MRKLRINCLEYTGCLRAVLVHDGETVQKKFTFYPNERKQAEDKAVAWAEKLTGDKWVVSC